MKSMKFLLLFAILSLGGLAANAQSDWMKIQADKRVEEINNEITSVDPSAALSEAQKTQLHGFLIKNFEAIRDINKGEGTKEEKDAKVAEKRKELWAQIHKEVFTKAQAAARKKAKELAGN